MCSITYKDNIIKLLCYIFFLCVSNSAGVIYKTSSTNCNLEIDANSNDSDKNTHLLSCTQKICLKNLIGGKCANEEVFLLQEQNCLRECCGSNQFSLTKCQQYNNKRQLLHKSQDEKLISILLACLIGLLITIFILSVFIFECCCTEEQIILKKNKEYSSYWKYCQFTSQQQCYCCKEKGAFIMLNCKTFFHLKCMKENSNWKCSHCSRCIKKIKMFCPFCLSKYIVIQSGCFTQLNQKVKQMYEFHPSKCAQFIDSQIETERKLTQTTKQ